MWVWFWNLFPLFLVFLLLSWRQRPAAGLAAVPLAFALPVWVQWVLFEVPAGTIVGAGVPLKYAIAILAVSAYPFLSKASFPLRLVPCDFAVLGLIATHCFSDFLNSGISWTPIVRAAAEWYFPYMAGRLALQSRGDWQTVWPIVAGVATVLGATAIFEAVTGINPYELLYGLRPLENTPRDAARWGIRRAYGPCLNPIYLGILQLVLFGWSLFAARMALRREAHSWWLLAPMLTVLGIACTGSRGPILGAMVVLTVIATIRFPKLRLPLLALILISGTIAVAQREQVIRLLERWSGESETLPNKSVTIDDEQQKFSGTRSRLLMLDVYRIALKRSGFLGYGTEATTGFPLRVPLEGQEIETLRRVRYVDNSYALIMLRFGYLGVFFYASAGAMAVWQALRLAAFYHGEASGTFALFIGASLTGGLATILSVWLAPDFGFALIWTMGITSGMLASHWRDEWVLNETADS